MAVRFDVPVADAVAGGGRLTAHICCSERADGDFHLETLDDGLAGRRRALVDLGWTQPDEVHGTAVAVVGHPGDADGAVADALITDVDDAVLGIWVGDCAPVALIAETGRIGAAHAGWRGLAAGVLDAAVDVVRAGDAAVRVRAVLGPCIHPCCYEFGADDLAAMTRRFGSRVGGRTADGRRALDMPAAVRAALAALDVELEDRSMCTGCHGDRFFSHRVRGERQRQVMAVWRTRDEGWR